MSTEVDALRIRSRSGEYEVQFPLDAGWTYDLRDIPSSFFIIDQKVWDLHKRGCLAALSDVSPHLLPATEDVKTLDGVATLADQVIRTSAKRNTTIVSIGGGVIQDVTGFLASVVYRGVRWVYVPTTLLAQADSCIGSKTSLNFRHFKNLLGTMYPPERVLVSSDFLPTLDDDQYFSGLGEIAKMHVVAGEAAMDGLTTEMPALAARDEAAVMAAARRSLMIKRGFIEEDEFDRGRRRLLNFGHCFGHAIEAATDFAVPHGQAVVLGMILAGLVACERGRFTRARLDEATRSLFLPTLTRRAVLAEPDHSAVVEAMGHDKKRTGKGLAVVIPQDDWDLRLVDDVDEHEALAALSALPRVLSEAGWRPQS